MAFLVYSVSEVTNEGPLLHHEAGRKFAALVRRERLRVGMSQEGLAREVGIATSTLRNIEAGRVLDPGFFVAGTLLITLGVSASAIEAAIRGSSPPS